MKIIAEIEVKYDDTEPKRISPREQEELRAELSGAVSECSWVENVASAEVKKLTIIKRA